MIHHHFAVSTLCGFCMVMGIAVCLFFLYHFWLILQNETTNERAKRDQLKGVSDDHLRDSMKQYASSSKESFEEYKRGFLKEAAVNAYDLGWSRNLRESLFGR